MRQVDQVNNNLQKIAEQKERQQREECIKESVVLENSAVSFPGQG